MNLGNKRFFGRARKKEGAARKPSRFFTAMGLAGMLLAATLSGCGNDEGANYTGWVMIMPDFAQFVEIDWEFASQQGAAPGVVYPVAPVQFVVFDTNGLSVFLTPVPGAEVTIYFGGSALQSVELYDSEWNLIGPAGTGLYHTKANDHGAVEVFVVGTLPACWIDPAAEDYTIDGSLSVTAQTSGNNASWTAAFALNCLA